MSAPGRNLPRPQDANLPRPEDAASWEEFRVRWSAERAVWGPSASPSEAKSQAVLGMVFGFGAAVFWAAAVFADGAGRWALAALAALSTWMFARYFTRGVRRGAFGRGRYWKLAWRSGHWRAKLARDRALAAREVRRG